MYENFKRENCLHLDQDILSIINMAILPQN